MNKKTYYRIHFSEQAGEDFVNSAATWVWDDLGSGMVAVEIPGVYSAISNIDDLRAYIVTMKADDTDVIAVFEGTEVEEANVNGIIYHPYESDDGEIWVEPTALIRFAKPSEFTVKQEAS